MTAGSAAPPRVSVITTVYNAERFLEPTLLSLLNQNFTDFEAIVVDDGSKDQSAALVQRLARDDDRIRLFRQENRGFSHAVNRGLSEARGEFVAFLDHDDLWHPDKLALQLECFEQAPDVGMVACYSALLDADRRHTGWRFGTRAHGQVYRQMVFCDLVAGGSVPMVRRAVIDQAGPFDTAPKIQGRSDWDEWLRISRLCDYAMVEAPLVGYTRRPENYSSNYQRMIRAGKTVLDKAAVADPQLVGRSWRATLARDAFGIFCLAMADEQWKEAGRILRYSLSISWRPVALAPHRWGMVTLFVLARLLPRRLYRPVWRCVAQTMFGLTPGTAFSEPTPATRERSAN